jgi:hypothetical protein
MKNIIFPKSLKKGNKIAMIIVQTIHQTQTITIGSIAVARFFTILSISLLYLTDIFPSKLGNLPVCSQIFTKLDNSRGKYSLSFQVVSNFIHIASLSGIQFDILIITLSSSFSK